MRETFFGRHRLDVLAWVVAFKALVLGFVYVLAVRTPSTFNVAGYFANLHWTQGPPTTATWFATWDAMHYLFLSEHGYLPGHPTLAFYPLWPLLIRLAAFVVGGHSLLVALSLSNLFSAIALWLMYHLVREQGGSSPGVSTSLLLLYPGSLFFAFPYTESLYLLLSVVLFQRLSRADERGAAAAAFFLTLTRPLGMFAVLPMACQFVGRARLADEARNPSLLARAPWLLLPVPLALGAHFGFMYLSTGDALAGIKAQRFFITGASLHRLLQPLRFLHVYADVRSLHGMLHSFLDRLWFTLAAALMPVVYRISRPMFWYTLGVGVFSAVTMDFMSFTRYLCVLFPIFIAAGQVLTHPPRKLLLGAVLTLFVCLHVVLVFLHVHAYWVG